MPRGRPVGTTKRDVAITAAQAVWGGQFPDVRSAAFATFHHHAGGKQRVAIASNERERFRNFVEYVEEAYRELLETNNIGSLRRYAPLSERSSNRSSQTKPTLKHLRDMLADRN